MKRLVAGLACALALAGCGSGTVSLPIEHAPVKDAHYTGLDGVVIAYSGSGGTCGTFPHQADLRPQGGHEFTKTTCGSDAHKETTVYLFRDGVNVGSFARSIIGHNKNLDHQLAFLIGDGWAISSNVKELRTVQSMMGGRIKTG